LALHYVLTAMASTFVQKQYGLSVVLSLPDTSDLKILLAIAIAGTVAGTLPALHAYRKSLADGLSQRL